MGTAFDPAVLGTILGPTRIGVANPVGYVDFEVSMTITDTGTIGDDGPNPWILLGARITDFGPGTTKGYAVQLGRTTENKRSFSLVKIENEATTYLNFSDGNDASIGIENYTEISQYKIVFTGIGSLLTVFIDDLTTEAPGFYFSVNDDTYTAGRGYA